MMGRIIRCRFDVNVSQHDLFVILYIKVRKKIYETTKERLIYETIKPQSDRIKLFIFHEMINLPN